jgi:hypothetical protein
MQVIRNSPCTAKTHIMELLIQALPQKAILLGLIKENDLRPSFAASMEQRLLYKILSLWKLGAERLYLQNPYHDGTATQRIIDAIWTYFQASESPAQRVEVRS